MSDIFDDTLTAAAESFFLLPGAEWVDYFPRGGSARRIRAVISRNGPENLPNVAGGSTPQFTALVRNHATLGITSDEVDSGGDTIEVGPRVAEVPKTRRITEVLNHDAGLMLLLLQ